MNLRLFAALFTALFFIGAFPIVFIESFGSASAGMAAGFMAPAQNPYHVATSIAIGLLSVWAGNAVILVLPLCTLLMLATGSLMEIDGHNYPAVHYFIVGAIILFSLSMSLLRGKALILSIPPFAAWAYFAGNNFMQSMTPSAAPLFFLVGIIVSNAMILAMGVALGITLADTAHETMDKLKRSTVFATFLSLF